MGDTINPTHSLSILQRRHLEPGEKREIAKQYLLEDWDGEESQKAVASKLGVSEQTVGRARQELEEFEQQQSGKEFQLEYFPKEEKQAQVREHLDENPDASNREIAESVEADVSYRTVGNWRNENSGSPPLQYKL